MDEHFNVYRHFAGCFVPYWLLSRQEIGASCKLAYALLAQQANSRGITQVNFNVQESALGESDGELAQDLAELEEAGLIRVSRGNVQSEDVRVYFPPHPWMNWPRGNERVGPAPRTPPDSATRAACLFPEVPTSPITAADAPLATTAETAGSHRRRPRGRRRARGKPQSAHSFETCLRYVRYQKEVLGRQGIWNVMGLANHLHRSGEQDEEVAAWLKEEGRDVA